MSMSPFGELGKQAGDLAQKQTQLKTELETAATTGELRMEDGSAERAAARCDQAASDINASLAQTRQFVQKRRFGDNEDGNNAAGRFAHASQEYIAMMEKARTVIQDMASAYRAAGQVVAEADAAGRQTFQGQSG